MKTTSAAAIFGAALLTAGAPALAQMAPYQQGPIHLDSAHVAPLIDEGTMTQDGGFVRVAFTNERSVPATDVVFAVVNQHGATLQTIHDRGTFSRGVKVSHLLSTLVSERHVHLTVARVRFADGSSWVRHA
jgi:hypothetical protein